MLYSFFTVDYAYIFCWWSVKKETGMKFQARSNSSVTPSGQIAVEDKGGGVIASFETVRRKFRLNRNEKRSDFHLQRRFISLIVHFSREWNEKRFVIGHCVPMLRGLLFRDEGKKRTRIETSPVFESLNCKIRSFLGLWNARLAILYSNDFIR